jgi:sugar phosphate isomerase/epimerase
MKIAVSAKIYDKMDIHSIIEESARIGYDGIEFRDNPEQLPVDTSPELLAEVKKHLGDAGIAATSLATFTGGYAAMDDGECAVQLEKFKKFVHMAQAIGAYNVRHWPGPFGLPSRKAEDHHFERAALWLAKACDYAAEYGICVAVELHHRSIQDTTDSALRLHDMTGRDNLKFTPDGQNYYFDAEPYCAASIGRLGRHRITNVHLKDAVILPESDASPRVYRYEGRTYVFRPINEGGVDHYGMLSALKDIGYDSYVTVESAFLMTPMTLAEHEYREVCKVFDHLQIRRG